MTLATSSKLPIATAKMRPDSESSQIETAKSGVGMAQITSWSLLDIRGVRAEMLVSDVYSAAQMAIGAVESVSDGILVRLRRDEFLVLTADLKPTTDRLTSKPPDGLITLTDITHGRGVIGLVGAHAHDVLSKICALDFADSKFPNWHAAQAMLANIRALIIRGETAQNPAYLVIVDRSLTSYVWQIILDAAQEWGGIVLNQNSFDLTGKQ